MSTDEIIKPDVSEDLAKKILQRHYGISVKRLKEVNSYDDRNFVVVTDKENRYILKVSNIVDTRKIWKLEFQNEILDRLSGEGLPVQKPISSQQGRLIEFEEVETRLKKSGETGKRSHALRLLSYLPGHVVHDKQVRVDSKLLYNIGQNVAKVDQVLTSNFKGKAPSSEFLWSIMAVPQLRDYVFAVREESQRKLVLEAIKRFESEFLPVVDSLTHGVIHGDPNEQNILVKERQGSTGLCEVSGVLDWQDTHSCPIIVDLGLLCMYMMSGYSSEWKTDVEEFSMTRHCVEGFTSVWALSRRELELLPTLVISRFAQSLCLGAYHYYELDPTNDYLLVTAARGWKQLEHLCSLDQGDLFKTLTGLELARV